MHTKQRILEKLHSTQAINIIIKNAIRNGHLSVENSCCVLAVYCSPENLKKIRNSYNLEPATAFDHDDKAFEQDILTVEGRFHALFDLFEMFTREKFWGWDQPDGYGDKLKTYAMNKDDYTLVPDGKNGTLLNLDELREFLLVHGVEFPKGAISEPSATGYSDKETDTNKSNQSEFPYQSLGIERAKQCLLDWKNADGFITTGTLTDGMVLCGYDVAGIRRIYEQCGYTNWTDVREKPGWQQIAWNGIIHRLACDIFFHKGTTSTQGEYAPLQVYKKSVTGAYYPWDSSQGKEPPEPAYVKFDDLDSYLPEHFGIHAPPYKRIFGIWPLEPFCSCNKTDEAFWEKSWEIGFPEGYVSNDLKGGDDWQEKALRAYKEGGAVQLFELACILSKNKKWSQLLKGLWEICGFNSEQASRDFPQWDDCFLIDGEALERAWFWVLARLAIKEKRSFEITETDPVTKKLDVYRIERECFYFGKLLDLFPVDSYRVHIYDNEGRQMAEFESQRPGHLIRLDQFQKQILGIYQLCQSKFKDVPFPEPLIKIPGWIEANNKTSSAPGPLFAPDPTGNPEAATGPQVDCKVDSVSLIPIQKPEGQKEKTIRRCREEAIKQWAENEWLTYREIYDSESMQEILMYKNGKGGYKLDWMRKQIKDLNPHRGPGTRKGQTKTRK